MMLDPILLRSFDAVAQTHSFTEAAQRLRLAQSTISGHVARLERSCGRRLFVRDTHSVALTPDGEAMAGFARSVLEADGRARRHFSASNLRGRLRFGVSEDLVLRGLPDVLRQFVKSHPAVDLELTVGLSGSMHEQLQMGALDLIFVKRTGAGQQGETVWREQLAWIGRPDARLDPAAPVPLILLAPPSITRARAGCTCRRGTHRRQTQRARTRRRPAEQRGSEPDTSWHPAKAPRSLAGSTAASALRAESGGCLSACIACIPRLGCSLLERSLQRSASVRGPRSPGNHSDVRTTLFAVVEHAGLAAWMDGMEKQS